MKEKGFVLIIFLLCFIAIVPPMFAPGGTFDVTYIIEVCNENVVVHGLYFDNVYYTVLLTLLSFIGISLPYLRPNLSPLAKIPSTLVGIWFVAGLLFELINFAAPEIILNNSVDSRLYIKFLMLFALGLTGIITHKEWNKQRST